MRVVSQSGLGLAGPTCARFSTTVKSTGKLGGREHSSLSQHLHGTRTLGSMGFVASRWSSQHRISVVLCVTLTWNASGQNTEEAKFGTWSNVCAIAPLSGPFSLQSHSVSPSLRYSG